MKYHRSSNWQVLEERDGSDTLRQWFAYGNYIDEVFIKANAYDVFTYIQGHILSAMIQFLGVTSSGCGCKIESSSNLLKNFIEWEKKMEREKE